MPLLSCARQVVHCPLFLAVTDLVRSGGGNTGDVATRLVFAHFREAKMIVFQRLVFSYHLINPSSQTMSRSKRSGIQFVARAPRGSIARPLPAKCSPRREGPDQKWPGFSLALHRRQFLHCEASQRLHNTAYRRHCFSESATGSSERFRYGPGGLPWLTMTRPIIASER